MFPKNLKAIAVALGKNSIFVGIVPLMLHVSFRTCYLFSELPLALLGSNKSVQES